MTTSLSINFFGAKSVVSKFTKTVSGLESDYFVMVGMNCNNKHGFPERRFFWSNSKNYKFSELPSPLNKFASIFNLF